MDLKDEYFKLCYKERIHEYSKIDHYKGWVEGAARNKYTRLDEFYQDELQINTQQLNELRVYFSDYNDLYSKYYNPQREELFENPHDLLEWYKNEHDSCNYCGISKSELYKIVENRGGNLTLNQKTKRSKGMLEIEKLNPIIGYTFKNSVLACPFCNNAKSNLISEEDWRRYFVPSMKQFLNKLLSE